MSKITKIWLITASALVALGAILFAGVMAKYDWDFTKLSTVTYVTNTYEVHGEFDKILVNVDTTEIEFVPTEDKACSIVFFEAEKVKHSATIQNGTLIISTVDTRKWYDHICISFGSPKMTVYLPQNEYASLIIETDTGDINIPKDFAFDKIEIDGDTSDVSCFAPVANVLDVELSTGDINIDSITVGQVNLTTTTGEITVNSVTAKNNIDIETDTGKVKLTNISCSNFVAESDTGTITLKKVVATGSLFVESDTGDVKFDGCDAAEIFAETDTGDVTGTLLSEKVFIVETDTGSVDVPKTATGGKCEITTSTGDIDISIKQ